jgi:hypothetical protein
MRPKSYRRKSESRLLCRWTRQFDIEKYARTAGHYRRTCKTVFWLPELPRWLVTHGRVEEAEAILGHIESGHGVAFQWLGERTIFRKK